MGAANSAARGSTRCASVAPGRSTCRFHQPSGASAGSRECNSSRGWHQRAGEEPPGRLAKQVRKLCCRAEREKNKRMAAGQGADPRQRTGSHRDPTAAPPPTHPCRPPPAFAGRGPQGGQGLGGSSRGTLRLPSAASEGWRVQRQQQQSRSPPSRRALRCPLRLPSGATSATQSSVSSHGMLGCCQHTQASLKGGYRGSRLVQT